MDYIICEWLQLVGVVTGCASNRLADVGDFMVQGGLYPIRVGGNFVSMAGYLLAKVAALVDVRDNLVNMQCCREGVVLRAHVALVLHH